jgi:hypothetical protein
VHGWPLRSGHLLPASGERRAPFHHAVSRDGWRTCPGKIDHVVRCIGARIFQILSGRRRRDAYFWIGAKGRGLCDWTGVMTGLCGCPLGASQAGFAASAWHCARGFRCAGPASGEELVLSIPVRVFVAVQHPLRLRDRTGYLQLAGEIDAVRLGEHRPNALQVHR